MSFVKTVTTVRRAETRVGDTLQVVALREMGDASRWYDLAALNGLLPPYLTDDPAQAGSRVLLTGSAILVPSGAPPVSGVADPTGVFGIDVALAAGLMTVDVNGDLSTVAGVSNLKSALEHRLETQPGELLFHADYGCRVHALLGGKSAPAVDQLAAAMVDSAVRSDPRVARTTGTTATIGGDKLQVASTAITIDDKIINISLPNG